MTLALPSNAALGLQSRAPSAAVAALEDARIALEALLELGTRVIDADTSALVGIPSALAITIRRLDAAHDAIEAAASCVPTSFGPVLSRHVEHRRRADARELDRLSEEVAAAEHPRLIGRGVVVAALTLLSNLRSDERWFQRKRRA